MLIKVVEQWSAANNGELPKTYKQKKELMALLEALRRPGVQADQNIDEVRRVL